MKSLLLSAFLFFGLPFLVFSQHSLDLDYYLPDDVSYNEEVPTPNEILGHEVGEWHVTHDKLVSYMYTLAEASDRITLKEYGRTHEHRPLILLTITSPDNHASINLIKENQNRLTDPEQSGDLDVSNMPAIVKMGYSVHGNEPSGSNASLIAAYHFAAAQGSEIEEQLDNVVVLLDPAFNPDGLNRFATWANMHKSHTSVTDPAAREFDEVWPGGRTNHYWFDLNRDWLPVQHPEGRGRASNFHEWKPNIVTDHHEMGTNSTFFFQPGIPSRTHPLTPQQNQDLTAAIGEYHAEYLNEIQSLYYTKESYDDFYYGKGSTYPDVQGSIGILFEQASSRGHAQESDNGLLEFPFTIRNQFTTTLSTFEAAFEMREELMDYMRGFYRDAVQEASGSSVRAIVIGDENDQGKNYHLADMMSHHDIEFYELGQDLRANGEQFRANQAYVIPMEQPQYKLINAMFERRTEFTDSLFYDISTWTMPFAFNMPFAELTGNQFSQNMLGNQIQNPVFPEGEVVGGRSDYAYAFNWDEYYAPRALYRLQKMGIRTRVAARPFQTPTANGVQDFEYGAVVIPLGIQDKVNETDIFRAIQTAATEDGVDFYSLQTGLSTGGIDLGSRNLEPLEKPSVAIIAGSGVSNLEVGEIWHLMDQRYQIPLTVLEKDRVRATDLGRYNSIIMVNGGYSDLSEEAQAKLKNWVDDGGTLILQKSAINWARNAGLIEAEQVRASARSDSGSTIPYVDLQATQGAQNMGGSIFHARLDITHPLGYGFKNPEMYTFKNSNLFFSKAENPYATPLYLTDSPLASGYISEENLEASRNSASILVHGYGSGRIINFVDNPNFRAFWFGTNKLFANALFFGNTISGGAAQ